MDEDRTASLSPFFILTLHCSHTPHVSRGSGATTIRTYAGQSDCAIDVDSFSPYLSAAAVLYYYYYYLCVPCAHGAAACCAMPACVNKKRRFDCWRPASSPLHLRTNTNTNNFWTRLMAAGRNAATWSVLALVFFSRHRDRPVMQPFGNRSGASGRLTFCRDSTNLRGDCVGGGRAMVSLT
ncbi:hypothetical protein TcG_13009 [Trypanosoma cruzi]|nr:hypothetical protein TcG_13009 [Trypanosoma cruzi]